MASVAVRFSNFINYPPKQIEKRRHAEYFGIFLSCISGFSMNIVGIVMFALASLDLAVYPCILGALLWCASTYLVRIGKFELSVIVALVNMIINVAIITWVTGTEFGAQMIFWSTIAMATLNTAKNYWVTSAVGLFVVAEMVVIYAYFPTQAPSVASIQNPEIVFLIITLMTGAALMFVLIRLKSMQIKQSKRLQKQIYNDELTGLYNRHFLYELLDYELEMMKKARSPFCLCFADVDHFKQVNDTYGHQVGDEVLIGIAEALTENLRKSDVICRWGGEEFVVVLPRCSIDQAPQVIAKVKSSLNDKLMSSKDLSVTMSFGIVTLSNEEPIEAILKRADELLYIAKENGRDRIEVEVQPMQKKPT